VLHVDDRAAFVTEGAWVWTRHRFTSGTWTASDTVRPRHLAALELLQRDLPVLVMRVRMRQWWWFRDAFYWEDEELNARDVMLLIDGSHPNGAHGVVRLHPSGRADIPREIRLRVWDRDGGRCRRCGGGFELRYDHVIPVALGGTTSVNNLRLLCAACNRAKGASL
jgi:hypothetical protein